VCRSSEISRRSVATGVLHPPPRPEKGQQTSTSSRCFNVGGVVVVVLGVTMSASCSCSPAARLHLIGRARLANKAAVVCRLSSTEVELLLA